MFGKQQVKIYLQEDLRDNSKKVIDDLYGYLKIDNSFLPNTNQEHNAFSMPKNNFVHKLYASHQIRTLAKILFPNVLKEKIKNTFFERKKKPTLKQSVRNDLREIYTKDIQKLEKLINRDLSHWYKEEKHA